MGSLFGLRGILLGAFGGLNYQVTGFGFDDFEVLDVAVDLAGILADERLAFPFL